MQQQTGERRSEALAISGGLIVPLVAYFVLPAIPRADRTIVGLVFGALFFLIAIFFVASRTRALQADIAQQGVELREAMTSMAVDPTTGVVHKGAVRNVSLRVATVHHLINTLVQATPLAKRQQILRKAGLVVGKEWGEVFLDELQRTHIHINTLDEQLELWSHYDATAGMGRLRFAVSLNGEGTVTLNHGFLASEDAIAPLDYFIEGYLEGGLTELLGHSCTVSLQEPATERHTQSVFTVTIS
ncbi:MAG: hypothetical protein ACYDEP_12110 [Acidimicrobiales bacterium]